MNLYEIDQRMADLLSQVEPDPETGEAMIESEDLMQELDLLGMARAEKLENLAKYILDIRAEAAKVKAEKTRLADTQKRLENKEKSLMRLMEEYTAGENTDCGIAKVSYRTTKSLDVSSASDAAAWLQANGYPDLYTVGEVSLDKTSIKKLLGAGEQIPGVALKVGRSCSLK